MLRALMQSSLLTRIAPEMASVPSGFNPAARQSRTLEEEIGSVADKHGFKGWSTTTDAKQKGPEAAPASNKSSTLPAGQVSLLRQRWHSKTAHNMDVFAGLVHFEA